MSTTILERVRSTHEDIENYERAVINVLNEKCKNVSRLDYMRLLFYFWVF